MQTASYQAIDKKGSLRIHHNDQQFDRNRCRKTGGATYLHYLNPEAGNQETTQENNYWNCVELACSLFIADEYQINK